MSDVKFIIPDDKAPASSADKPRRGRPPGSKNGTRSTAGNATDAKTLSQALASMDSLYNMGVMGLTLFGLTGSADMLAAQTENLRKTNEEALKASPRLAAAIANAGSVGGATAFFAANIMALAPVVLAARMELFSRAQERESNESAPVDNVSQFPGA